MTQSVNLGEKPSVVGIRDAIHIAVISMEAAEKLNPGDHIQVDGGMVRKCSNKNQSVGIVDPFGTSVKRGDGVWVCLKPNTVTSIKHVWEHPLFEHVSKNGFTKEESERWIRDYCNRANCPGYDEVVSAAVGEVIEDYGYGRGYEIDGEYLLFLGRDAGGEIPSELWDHIENVTGKKCVWRPKYFSCSC
jgi:hypothetical protein